MIRPAPFSVPIPVPLDEPDSLIEPPSRLVRRLHAQECAAPTVLTRGEDERAQDRVGEALAPLHLFRLAAFGLRETVEEPITKAF